MIKFNVFIILFLLKAGVASAQREPYSFLKVIQAGMPIYSSYPDSIIKALPNISVQRRELIRFEGALPLLQFYSNRLIAASLPAGYAVIPILESNNSPKALSRVGALGVWQLMPYTAKKYGLIVDFYEDERYSINQSTSAAINHLSYLSNLFAHPVFVLAAYNWGEKNVLNLIKQYPDPNLFLTSSKLPLETRDYINKVYFLWYALSILDDDHPLHFYPNVNYFSLDMSPSVDHSGVSLIHGYLNPVHTVNRARLVPTIFFHTYFQSKLSMDYNSSSLIAIKCKKELIENYNLYVVKPEDSLVHIINKFNIIDSNQKKFISEITLHPGLVIKIPLNESSRSYLKEAC